MSQLTGFRRAILGLVLSLVALAGVWTIPGLVTHEGAKLLAQQPAATDTQIQADRAPPEILPAPGTTPANAPVPLTERLRGLLGIALIIAIGVFFSRNRRLIPWVVVGWGFVLQIIFAIFVLRVPAGQVLFRKLGDLVTTILSYSYQGSQFVFGELGKQHSSVGVVFAFQILPAIIFVSALFAIMYYLGIMQVIVRAFAIVMAKLMKTSGAESLDVAASIFMGQTEAPLTIRPFLPRLTRSELMTVMTAGMAHISGSIMVAYIAFGVDAKHLLTAVIMTAPGTIMMAKIFEPEDAVPETYGNVKLDIPSPDVNLVAAAARGTSEGLHLMLNVIAMLISFVALVALFNGLLGALHNWLPWVPQSLQVILGWIGRPIAWAMGVSWQDSSVVGGLLGTRAVLNEFIAYAELGQLKASLDPRSFTIASFALAGFANFASVGIQIGGIGALAPERKEDLARLGFRAMLAGTLANFLSATIAGMLL